MKKKRTLPFAYSLSRTQIIELKRIPTRFPDLVNSYFTRKPNRPPSVYDSAIPPCIPLKPRKPQSPSVLQFRSAGSEFTVPISRGVNTRLWNRVHLETPLEMLVQKARVQRRLVVYTRLRRIHYNAQLSLARDSREHRRR